MLTEEEIEIDFQVNRMTKSWKEIQMNIQSSFEDCRFLDYLKNTRDFYAHPLARLMEDVVGKNDPIFYATRIVKSFNDMLDKVRQDIESSGWYLSEFENVGMDAQLIDTYFKNNRKNYDRYLPLRKLTMPDGRTSGFVMMLTTYGGRTRRPKSIGDIAIHLVFAKITPVNHGETIIQELDNKIKHNESLVAKIAGFENELKINNQENLVVEETNILLKSIQNKILDFQMEKELLSTTCIPPTQDSLLMEEQFLCQFEDIYQININTL